MAIQVFTRRSVNRALNARVSFHRGVGWRRFVRMARATAGFSLSRVAVTTYQTAPLLILSQTAPSVVTGIYASIETVHKLFVTATYPITDALFGRTARTGSIRPFIRYGLPLLLLFIVAIAFAALKAESLLHVMGGQLARDAAPALRLILIASAAAVTSVFIGYPLAGALGHVKAVNKTTLVSPAMVCAIFAIGLLAGANGLYVALAAVIGAEAVVLASRVWILRRMIHAGGR